MNVEPGLKPITIAADCYYSLPAYGLNDVRCYSIIVKSLIKKLLSIKNRSKYRSSFDLLIRPHVMVSIIEGLVLEKFVPVGISSKTFIYLVVPLPFPRRKLKMSHLHYYNNIVDLH